MRARKRARDGRALLGHAVARSASSSRSRIASRARPRLLHRGLRGARRRPRRERRAGARPLPTSIRARSTSTSGSRRSSSTHRAPPGGRRASRARTARSAPAGSRRSSSTASARSSARSVCMPLYHTMGIHSLLADPARGRLLRRAARVGRRDGAAAHRAGADHLALPRADALLRPRPPPAPRRLRHVEPCAPSRMRAPR